MGHIQGEGQDQGTLFPSEVAQNRATSGSTTIQEQRNS